MEPDSFCHALYPKLVGSLRLSFGPGIAAEDVAQEALVRALERWEKVAAMDYPEAWVFRVALKLARSRLRRHRAESRANERLAQQPSPPGGADADDVIAVRAAVAELPKRQRQAVVLRFYADLTVDQVAEAMKCRPGTVKAHLHQGLVQQLVSFEPAKDRWTVLSRLPAAPGGMWALASFDRELIAYPLQPGTASPPVRVYDPSTGHWSDLSPQPPNTTAETRTTSVSSRQLIGVGSKLYQFIGTSEAAGPRRDVVGVFDGHRWKEFSHATGGGLDDKIWAAVGDHFASVNQLLFTMAPEVKHPPMGPMVLTFDQSTEMFAEPSVPASSASLLTGTNPTVVANGHSLAMVSSNGSLIVSGSAGASTNADGPGTQRELQGFAATWAGRQLVVWGGFSFPAQGDPAVMSNQGWVWTQPPPMTGSQTSPTSPVDKPHATP